jgi:hypothetical protein
VEEVADDGTEGPARYKKERKDVTFAVGSKFGGMSCGQE